MSSFWRKIQNRKKVDNTNLLTNDEIFLRMLIAFCNGKRNPIRSFSAEELEKATDHYNITAEIARGWEHKLYRGFPQDRPICVMKFAPLKYSASESFNNIVFASQMSHKNVLKLIGCCLETKIPILVFESVKYGTFHDRILGCHQPNFEPLLWKHRLKIAMDIANVIAYLHVGFPRPIVFKDINPLTILLDEQYVAKLFDFSQSKYIPEGETHIETEYVSGTVGYLAPELILGADYNEKSDVYSFGALLVVLLTGKPVVDVMNSAGEDTEEVYMKRFVDINKLIEIIDPVIIQDGSDPEKEQQLLTFAELTFECVNSSPEDRPTMIDVAKKLRQMYLSPA